MIKFGDFIFSGDLFYKEETVVPLSKKGITLFRGVNLDATDKGNPDYYSNGTGKSRLAQILCAFIFGSSDRDHYKKMFSKDFKGSLSFENTISKTQWNFSFDMKEEHWEITMNGSKLPDFHKPSEAQALLAKELGADKNDWGHFVHINQSSIYTLLAGDPAERRKYLESFFNIDTFYEEQRQDYIKNKQSLEEQIQEANQQQARLGQVLDTLNKLENKPYIDQQLQLAAESLTYLKSVTKDYVTKQQQCSGQLSTWNEYYRLCDETKDLPALEVIRTTKAETERKLAEYSEKQRLVVTVSTKARELESYTKTQEPLAPNEVEPVNSEVFELQAALGKMQEKMKLVDRYKKVKGSLPQKPELEEQVLSTNFSTITTELAELKHHLTLVKDGDTCTHCGQTLAFILNTDSPEAKAQEIKSKIDAYKSSLIDITQGLETWKKYNAGQDEIDRLKNEMQAFPVFGKKIEDVEQEIKNKQDSIRQWRTYRDSLSLYKDKIQKKEILEAELKALGYPEVLKVDYNLEIRELKSSLEDMTSNFEKMTKLQIYVDKVLELTPKTTLDTELTECNALLLKYQESIDGVLIELGNYKQQLVTLEDLLITKEKLEKTLVTFPALQKEYLILEAMVKFFSPAGFKMYELRKRCEALIERANFWSHFFFQEVYEWSLPADLKQLDLLVQPIKHRDTPPYSAKKLSSGEINRASRVLLFSQLELTPPKKSLDLIFLDEIEGNLDKGGQNVFTETVISKLKETFPDKAIIIISHDESLKNSFDIDHLWVATKQNRKTSLETTFDYHRKVS